VQEQFCNLDGCLSLGEAQQRLQASGLSASPRQATRLLALHQRGCKLSTSALEALLSEGAALLMSPLWLQEPLPWEALRPALQDLGLDIRQQGNTYELLSSDELWLESQSAALVPIATQQVMQSMVGPALGSGDGWPESWRIVADAEDDGRILEHLRAAFRHSLAAQISPAPLLWLALKRRRAAVTQEVARLTREYLDPDLGRHLEALFSPVPSTAQAGVRALRRGRSNQWDLPFLVGLLQILWEQPELRVVLLELVEDMTDRWLAQPEIILGWWEECLAQTATLEPELVQRLAQLTLLWGKSGMPLSDVLERRLERGLSHAERLLASWLLSQLPQTSQTCSVLLEAALDLAGDPNLNGQTLVRVQQILATLGEPALRRLLETHVFASLATELRCWAVAQGSLRPLLRDAAEERALGELGAGSRRMLLQLAQLRWPVPAELHEDERWNLVGFLEQEIPHLEDPNDAWAIAWLVTLDPAVLGRLYTQAKRDGESVSRAYAARLETWAKHCQAADQAPESQQLDTVFSVSSPHESRPELWSGIARLASCSDLQEQDRQRLLGYLEVGREKFPQRWPEWWEEMQRSPVAELALRAERELLEVLRRRESPRATVGSCLLTLLRRARFWRTPEALVQALSQRLLFLPQPLSPQARMRWALAASDESDGTLTPEAWDAEQRDLALRILGELSLRADLPEPLRRPLRVRVWQFIQDWLDGVARGGDSYQHRSMPLWSVARRLLTHADEESDLVDSLAEQILHLQVTCPERLRLLTHSDCLGFLLDWSMISQRGDRAARQHAVLNLMQQLLAGSDRDYRPVAVGYLVNLDPTKLDKAVAGEWQRLRQRWQGWLYGQ
jgi:hypothetical protein